MPWGGGGGGSTPAPSKPKSTPKASQPKKPAIPATFLSNWQQRAAALKQVGYSHKQIITAYQYDYQRVKQGKKPLTTAQAYSIAHVIRHHIDQFMLTQARGGGGGVFSGISNAFSDLSSIVTNSIHLPEAAYHAGMNALARMELNTPNQKLPIFGDPTWLPGFTQAKRKQIDLGTQVGHKIRSGDIGGAAEDIFHSPQLSMIPGTYTAGIIAGQGPGGYAKAVQQHPVFAALDVLPYAAKAGELATAGKEAEVGSATEAWQAGNVPKALFRSALGTTDVARSVEGADILDKGLASRLPRTSEWIRAVAQDNAVAKTFRENIYRPLEVARRLYTHELNRVGDPLLKVFRDMSVQEHAQVINTLEGLSPESALPEHLKPVYEESKAVIHDSTMNLASEGKLTLVPDPNGVGYHTYLPSDPVAVAYNKALDLSEKAEVYAKDPNIPMDKLEKAITDWQNAEKEFQGKFARRAPRSFFPILYQHATEDLKALWEVERRDGKITPEQYEKYMQSIAENRIPKQYTQTYTKIIKDHQKYWYQEYQNGKQPIYVPQASEGQIQAMLNPTPFGDHVHAESTLKAASVSQFRPGVANIALQLTYAHMQGYMADISQELVTQTYDNFAHDSDFVRQFEENKLGKVKPGPFSSRAAKVDQAVAKNWVQWDEFTGALKGAGSRLERPGDMYVPRDVAEAMAKRLRQYETPASVMKFWDKSTKTFRIAVTTSPRHVVHVTTAGLMYSVLQEGPHVLLNARSAWQAVSDGFLERHPGLESGTHIAAGMTNDDIRNHFNGIAMGEVLKAHLEHIPVVGKALGGAFGKAANATEWLHNFEGHIAGMWKVASFMEERSKMIAGGMSPDEADLAAIDAANHIHMDADSMTPIERTITRNVAPFYAFQRQLLKVMFSYPGDHPLAASVIAAAGRMELADQNAALPSMFATFIKVPSALRPATDFLAGGNGSYIDVKTMNPFRNLGEGRDPWTISGLLSALNPAWRTPLEYIGVNTLTGNVNQFLGTHIDPYSGSQVTNPSSSLWSTVLQNYIPQSRIPIVSSLLGSSSYLDQLQSQDPAAYRRTLTSILGIPFVPFDPQINNAMMKQQLGMQAEAAKAVTAAAKSGDYSVIQQYSNLPYHGAVLTPDQLIKILKAGQ